MPHFSPGGKERLRLLAINLLLYVRPTEGGCVRPHSLRYKRNGEVHEYLASKGWRSLAGMKAEGPGGSDRWQF